MKSLVTVTDVQMEKARSALAGISNGAEKAVARAINRAVESARANMVKTVRDQYTAKAGDIRSSLTISKANAGKLQAEIRSQSPLLPLSSFKFSPSTVNGRRRSPIRVSVKKTGNSALSRSFVARVGGSRPHIFERVSTTRLPIKKLFGPSIPQMIGSQSVIKKISDDAQAMLDSRLDHEINRMLQQ